MGTEPRLTSSKARSVQSTCENARELQLSFSSGICPVNFSWYISFVLALRYIACVAVSSWRVTHIARMAVIHMNQISGWSFARSSIEPQLSHHDMLIAHSTLLQKECVGIVVATDMYTTPEAG